MKCTFPACGKEGRTTVVCLTDGDFAQKVVFPGRVACASHERAHADAILDRMWDRLAAMFFGVPRPRDAKRTYPKKDCTRFVYLNEGESAEGIPHFVRK